MLAWCGLCVCVGACRRRWIDSCTPDCNGVEPDVGLRNPQLITTTQGCKDCWSLVPAVCVRAHRFASL